MLALASCAKKEEKLVVGYTLYEPMNYEDASGKLIGFDTELAEAVAKKLDMEIEFKLIEWSKKYLELDSGNVNCLWNGFTSNCADDDGIQRSDKVDFSYAYMNNEQCVVVRSADAATLNTKEALAGKKGAAEDGSAGESVVKDFIGDNGTYIGCTAQTATLIELIGNTVDFVVIDKTMAKTLIGTGDYASLTMVDAIEIESEEYSVGFKKGSELTAEVNKALKELAEDGTMMELAKKYGLENYVITKFN
jgi:polar amino acid transport system substrate-binding protein